MYSWKSGKVMQDAKKKKVGAELHCWLNLYQLKEHEKLKKWKMV